LIARASINASAAGEKSLHPQNRRSPQRRRLFLSERSPRPFRHRQAESVELLEIRWPSGLVETLKDIKPNQVIFVKEGEGIVRTMQFDPQKPNKPAK